MTIQEAKDQVAKTRNCKDWKHFLEKVCFPAGYIYASELVADEVSELYAQSQVNEAHNNAVEKCINAINKTATPNGIAMFLIEELKKLKR